MMTALNYVDYSVSW